MLRAVVLCLSLIALVSMRSAAQTPQQIANSRAAMLEAASTAQALGSDDAEVRQAAIDRIIANPGSTSPFVIALLPGVLAGQGKTEDALKWSYFAQIRSLTDLGGLREIAATAGENARSLMIDQLFQSTNVVADNVPTARKRALFEQAVALEARTPRSYDPNALMPQYTPQADERATLQQRRRDAVATVRARFEQDVAAADTRAAIDADIAAHGVAREAQEFIPPAWRDRVRAVKSQRLGERCDHPNFGATPSDAAEQSFVYECPWDAMNSQTRNLHWLSASDLHEQAVNPAPVSGWSGALVVRDHVPFALFYGLMEGQAREGVLSGRGGEVVTLHPGPTATGGTFARGISPSGRLALRVNDGATEVVELANNTVLYRRPALAPDMQKEEWFDSIVEGSDGLVEVVGVRHSKNMCVDGSACVTEVIVWNTRTNAVGAVTIANAVPYARPSPYGDGEVIIALNGERSDAAPPAVENFRSLGEYRAAHPDNETARNTNTRNDPRREAIVDLEAMRVTWRGNIDDAPPPAHGVTCASVRDWDSRGFIPTDASRPAFHFSQAGAAFELSNVAGRVPSSYTLSGDRRHLLIVVPPFAHLYELDGAAH